MKNMYDSIVVLSGKSPAPGNKALVMVHGRGGSANDILSLSEHLNVKDLTLVAPQAENNTWYPFSFMAPVQQNQPHLENALNILGKITAQLKSDGISQEDIFFLGFSQGACLVSEFTCRTACRYGGIIILTGGVIGEEVDRNIYEGNFEGTPVFMGSGDNNIFIRLQFQQPG
jgi:phospholipase/carboxylesterase